MDLLKDVLGIGDNVLDFAKNSVNTMKLTGKRFFDNAANYLQNTAPAKAAQNALQQAELARISMQRDQQSGAAADRIYNIPQFLTQQANQSAPGRFATSFTEKTGVPDLLGSVVNATENMVYNQAWGAEAQRWSQEYLRLTQEAQAAQMRGDIASYNRLMAEAQQAKRASEGLMRSYDTQKKEDLKTVGSGTVNSMLTAGALANPAAAAAGAGTGAIIGGGISAITGNDIATGLGEGAGQGLKYAAVNKITSPIIDPIVDAAGKGLPIVAKLVSRALANGGLNLAEDEIFTRLMEGRAPTGSERAISLGAGAITSPFIKYDPQNSFLEIVDNKVQINQGWVRDNLGRFAEQVGLTPQAAQQKLEEALEVARQNAARQDEIPVNYLDKAGNRVSVPMKEYQNPTQPKINLDDQFFQKLSPGPKAPELERVNFTDVQPQKTKLQMLKERLGNRPPTQAAGVMAGVETYQDEEGRTRVRFDPAKAAAGIALTAGFTSTKGHLTDFEDVIAKAPDADEAGKVIADMTDFKVSDLIERIQAGDKTAINDLKGMRAAINKIMYQMANVDPVKGKGEKAAFEAAKNDPEMGQFYDILERKLTDIDDILETGGKNFGPAPKPAGIEAPSTAAQMLTDTGKKQVMQFTDGAKDYQVFDLGNGKYQVTINGEMAQQFENATLENVQNVLRKTGANLPDITPKAAEPANLIHYTKPENLDKIAVEGLSPDKTKTGIRGAGNYFYGKDNPDKLFPSGDVAIRIKPEAATKYNTEKFGGTPDQEEIEYVIRNKVNPEDLEVYKDGQWQPLKAVEPKYRYHATGFKNVEGIKNKGLLPHKGQYGVGAYFAPTEEGTKGYGGPDEVVLRVKKDALDTKYDYQEFTDEGWSSNGIAPEDIEIKQGDQWVPLVNKPALKVDIQPEDVNKPGQLNEQFFKADNQPLYHGSAETFDRFDPNRMNQHGFNDLDQGNGVYLTENKGVADEFSKIAVEQAEFKKGTKLWEVSRKSGNIADVEVSSDAKVLDFSKNKIDPEQARTILKKAGLRDDTIASISDGEISNPEDIIRWLNYGKIDSNPYEYLAKELGYDAIRIPDPRIQAAIEGQSEDFIWNEKTMGPKPTKAPNTVIVYNQEKLNIKGWNNAGNQPESTSVNLNEKFFQQPSQMALPEPESPKLLGPGTKEVSTGKEARYALKNQIPGQKIEVSNPQKPGKKTVIAGDGPIVVKSADAARRIKRQFPDADVVVETKPLKPGTTAPDLPNTGNEPQLGAGFFKVSSGKEARKANIPGATLEVDNPLKPGTTPIPLGPEEETLTKTNLGEVEKAIYGSETANPEDLGGTKEGAGKISDFLRSIQAKTSETVAKGLESQNSIVRNSARLAQGFAGGLGKSQDQVENKIRYKGSVDYAAKLATDVQQKVQDMVSGSIDSLERIHAVMDPELATEKVSYDDLTPEEQQATDFLRVVSDYINDTNYKNKFISKEKWLANRGGKYLARAYEEYDFPPEVADFMTQRNAKFDLNPFKKREGVTDWKQENAIRDPAYLTAKRLQQTLFNDEVKRYTGWLQTQKKLVSDTAKDGYVQLSDHKAYGGLAGKWIRKDAMEDIRGFFFTNEVAQKGYELLNWWDRNPLRRGRKKLLTVYNPAVRLGNETGNYVFSWLNGINPVTFAKNRQWAKQAIDGVDPIYRRMMKDGLLGSDVSKADITRIATELREGITDKSDLKKLDDLITDSYGRVDDLAKLSAMKTWLDRGYTYEEASKRVLNGFQSYSMVGFLYDLGAKIPVFGNPFVRFASEMTRISKNAVVDHPVRAVATVAAWKLFTDVMSRVSGESPKDRKTRESRIGAPRIPFTNTSLAVQTPWGEVNAARLIGLYAMNSTDGNFNSDISKMMPFQTPNARNVSSDPVIGPLIALGLDKDFRGKSISDPDQNKYTGSLLTDEEKNTNRLKYLVRSYNLPSLNDITDLIAAGKGEENFYGQKRSVKQAAARLFGLKVEQFGPEEAQGARDREAQYQQSRIESEQKKISTIKNQLKRGEITQDEAEKRIGAIQAGIDKSKGTIKNTTTGTTKLSPYLKQMYGIDTVEAMPTGSEYEQLKREKEAYKAIDTILDDEVLDDDQKQAAIDSLGLKKTEVDYYRLAKETSDLKAVYIQDQNLEHNELVQYLIAGRRKINGKMMADNTTIDYLYDEGMITKDEAKKLKKIEYDKDGNLILPSSGTSGGSSKLTTQFFNSQIKGLASIPDVAVNRSQTSFKAPQMPSTELDASTAQLTPPKAKSNQPALDQSFFTPKPKQTGVSAEAYTTVNRARGGGSINPGSTPRKLSQSFFSRRRS